MGHEIVKCKMVSILITAISNSCIHVKRIARYAIKGLWCWGQNRGRESVEEDRLSSEVLLLQVNYTEPNVSREKEAGSQGSASRGGFNRRTE